MQQQNCRSSHYLRKFTDLPATHLSRLQSHQAGDPHLQHGPVVLGYNSHSVQWGTEKQFFVLTMNMKKNVLQPFAIFYTWYLSTAVTGGRGVCVPVFQLMLPSRMKQPGRSGSFCTRCLRGPTARVCPHVLMKGLPLNWEVLCYGHTQKASDMARCKKPSGVHEENRDYYCKTKKKILLKCCSCQRTR